MKLFQRAALALVALTIASPVLAADAVPASANDPAAQTATLDNKAEPAAAKETHKVKKHHKKAAKHKEKAAKEDAKAAKEDAKADAAKAEDAAK